ncbi:PREDICTED: transcription factor TGA2.3-like isoform X1 [Camelina sativa]|uniref:Transcription factor TGA2.3-like isoform X1 n=1 Tax=Camelina sativa TaxID=90675 RepID=A0ABM0U1L4_CAMSA|nr:PREDICTED: transcription factor TGA2.3-like isoform X1 [Camelina sativa]
MRNRVEEKFLEFYENWVIQLEQYLHQLLIAHNTTMSEIELRALISKLTTHHKAYYTAKWAAIGEDVLAFFGPVWLTPLEKACFWLTGWKPSTVFRMVDRLRKSRLVLVEAQVRKLEELRAKTKFEEQKIEREVERYQVAMGDRKMVELARLGCHVGGESVVVVEAAVKGLATGLEKMVKAADCVRLKTLKGILDILAPPQCVEFLAAAAAFQVQLRRWGNQRHNVTHSYGY